MYHKKFFQNQVYNALSGNYKVSQIIEMIKKYKKNKIKVCKNKNHESISYHVDDRKLKKLGLN